MQMVQRFFTSFSDSFRKQGIVGKIILAGVVLFAFCCLCSIPISILSPSKSSSETTDVTSIQTNAFNTAIAGITANAPTITPEATNSPEPINTPSPEPTKVTALIPNIWQADVTLNLQDRFGMTCSDIEEGTGYYSHTCKKDFALIAIVYGRGIVDVDFITASYTDLNPSMDVAITYLGYVATIPFVGNDALQKQASEWVQANVPNIGAEYKEIDTDISGIHFKIRGKQEFITLEIGELR
jgi:hypothetical protein